MDDKMYCIDQKSTIILLVKSSPKSTRCTVKKGNVSLKMEKDPSAT